MFNIQNIKTSDILEVESALRAILRSKYPEVSAEQGSVLNDLVIKGLSYLAATIKIEATEISSKMYLADLEVSDSADSYQLLEDLAANFLVFNTDAPPKRGIVTFRFETNILRTIAADISLSRGGSFIPVKLFDSSQDIVISPDEYIANTIGGTTFYDYNLLMESVRLDSGASIPAGSFSSSVALVDLESIFNNSPFIGVDGTDYTKLSLTEKMQYSLQSRNFSTYNGIQATLLNEGIPNLIRVVGVGALDKEMFRDVIPSSLATSSFHSLGMANVVIASKLSQETCVVTQQSSLIGSKPIVSFIAALRDSVDVPIVSDFGTVRYTKNFDSSTSKTTIQYSAIAEGEAIPAGGISMTVSQEDYTLRNGNDAPNKFQILTAPGDTSLSLLVAKVDNNVPVVQGLIESDTYNTLASSIVAMGAMHVQLLIPNLQIKLARNLSEASLNINSVKSSIRSYIEEWQNDYPISVSGITAHLSLIYSGIVTSLHFNGGIKYIVYLPDGRFVGYSSTGLLSVEQEDLQISPSSVSYENELLPLQVSDRVLNFTVNSEDIAVEVTNV